MRFTIRFGLGVRFLGATGAATGDSQQRQPGCAGGVEIVRCVMCIRAGEWPSREEDVEEVDVDKLKEMVHVTDAPAGEARP